MSEKNEVKRGKLHEIKYLFIDGYNVINQSKRYTNEGNLEESRRLLIHQLIEYKAFTNQLVTVVFDAHQVKGMQPKIEKIEGVTVVFTRERQTADSYIEVEVAKLSKNPRNLIRVVTGDWAEQQAVLGSGALRVTVLEFIAEMNQTNRRIEKVTDPVNIPQTFAGLMDDQSLEKLKKMLK